MLLACILLTFCPPWLTTNYTDCAGEDVKTTTFRFGFHINKGLTTMTQNNIIIFPLEYIRHIREEELEICVGGYVVLGK